MWSRRRAAKAFLAFCGVGASAQAVAKPTPKTPSKLRVSRFDGPFLTPSKNAETFLEVKEWLDSLPNVQKTGSPTSVCQETGDEYQEIFVSGLSRPGDEWIVERLLAHSIQFKICKLFSGRLDGDIYWRIPLEFDVLKAPQIIEYRDDGPDKEMFTERPCVKDRDWTLVRAYCRLTVAIGDGVALHSISMTNGG